MFNLVDIFLIITYSDDNRAPHTSPRSRVKCPTGGRFMEIIDMSVKEPIVFEDQVEKLREHGCIVADDASSIEFLKSVNYYRFSAYFLPFRDELREDKRYIAGTTFEQVKGIYEFDKKLRAILFEAIEEIEIRIRTAVAYYHAHKHGALGYLDETTFNDKHQHSRFLEQFESEKEHNAKALFVRHHIANRDGEFPIWVAVELFTLGMLSHFVSDLLDDDANQVARHFNTGRFYLKSWVITLSVLRNICAHYGRLYYVNFTSTPKIPNKLNFSPTGKLFDQILMLKLLSPSKAQWNAKILPQIAALFENYKNYIVPDHIGFPLNWEDLLRNV